MMITFNKEKEIQDTVFGVERTALLTNLAGADVKLINIVK